MINGLIAIGYKDLWDDYDTVDPLSLLRMFQPLEY